MLVVEDEPDSRELLQQVLREHGAEVETAESAMDGYELLRTIRREAPMGLRDIPAIAITAFVRPEDKDRALAAGFALHLSKPMNPPDLVAAIDVLRPTPARE